MVGLEFSWPRQGIEEGSWDSQKSEGLGRAQGPCRKKERREDDRAGGKHHGNEPPTHHGKMHTRGLCNILVTGNRRLIRPLENQYSNILLDNGTMYHTPVVPQVSAIYPKTIPVNFLGEYLPTCVFTAAVQYYIEFSNTAVFSDIRVGTNCNIGVWLRTSEAEQAEGDKDVDVDLPSVAMPDDNGALRLRVILGRGVASPLSILFVWATLFSCFSMVLNAPNTLPHMRISLPCVCTIYNMRS